MWDDLFKNHLLFISVSTQLLTFRPSNQCIHNEALCLHRGEEIRNHQWAAESHVVCRSTPMASIILLMPFYLYCVSLYIIKRTAFHPQRLLHIKKCTWFSANKNQLWLLDGSACETNTSQHAFMPLSVCVHGPAPSDHSHWSLLSRPGIMRQVVCVCVCASVLS